MLQLRNIRKIYETGDTRVEALAGVSIDFRENEFVSILGPSGCGKTTLLNIVGGLDRYTDGDLLINGKSTKDFRDSDWDTYRNHSIGFVFQSYNLIPHQTVLANVELALTLSGVSKAERRRRATEALQKVGLGDQLKKKPNQMSGGQMQRVAIARAIVNDPDILLADEPTGALDTATSVQIMEILKEIAKDKLVIMVTHNPELAVEYSTRIVKLRDGRVIDDSAPFEAPAAPEEVVRKTRVKKGKRTSMSFLTAFSLSLNNLMTKKGRTFMTSFAGSIGIIGIALILALSNGINSYIALVQEDALSTYPLTIQQSARDMSAMMGAMGESGEKENYRDSGKIHVDDSLGAMMAAMSAKYTNDLESFKAYIDEHYNELKPYLSDLQYTYDFDLQVFSGDGKTQVNPTTIFDNMGESFSGVSGLMDMSGMNVSVLSEMIGNQDLLDQQYEVVKGNWPAADKPNQIVLVISENNQISKMTLYMLGVLPQDEVADIIADMMNPIKSEETGAETNAEGETVTVTDEKEDHPDSYTYDQFLGKKFWLLNTSDFYEKDPTRTYTLNGKTYPIWNDIRKDPEFEKKQPAFVAENGEELEIVGIVRPKEGATATSISTNLAYTKALTDHVLDLNTKSEIINQQKETPTYNVLTGVPFERTHYTPDTIDELLNKLPASTKEQFYAVLTQMILQNPASNMIKIENAEGLMGFYALMPDAQRVTVMNAILRSALASGKDMTMLFGMVTNMNAANLPGVTVTAQNFLQLLPVLSHESQLIALAGMDITAEQAPAMGLPGATKIEGLIDLAGEETMKKIYSAVADTVKTMTVTDEIFIRILGTMSAEDETFKTLEETLYEMVPDKDATFDSNLLLLGDAEVAKPMSINFYAKDFESKGYIEDFIAGYNALYENNEETKGKVIRYTDMVGILMSSITIIINAISYVLIAFVSISLIVSSIMIGIITYISVLERTKEIGILRAMGASKRDITRVFNAETLIIGLCAGLIGIIATVLICIPVSAIIQNLSGIPTLAARLPIVGGVILVLISTLLTVVAGLIPAFSAAKKDPVVALRTE